MAVDVRKGMPPRKLDRAAFEARFRSRFVDPVFRSLERELTAISAAAWDAYDDGRKAPLTRAAGPGFADPSYEIAVDWLVAREAVIAAQARHDDSNGAPRVLLINGSARTEHTCPGEMSKSWRLVELSEAIVKAEPGFECDVLNLSVLASEFNRVIYPCKSCVSTAMPLCHWPCSCYPNHSLQQNNDWMNEIYPRWVAAHGLILIAPVNWYQAPSAMKLMIDRLVCADGGNPDPSSTHGKDAKKAKEIELAGWPYPRHLAGRVFGVFAHGDSAGAETLRDSLHKWLTDMGLIPAGKLATVDRFICYLTPYATSHDDLDKDVDTQEDMRNVARTVVNAVKMLRAGKLRQPDGGLQEPRQK